MNAKTKPVELLQVIDFIANPIWEFTNDDAIGETAVHPVEHLPVENLDGKVVGTRVQLANGTYVWAFIGNIDSKNSRSTEHFLALSVENNGKWFTLSRYHDVDYARNGPESLALFLKLPLNAVFPISYDVTLYAIGESKSLAGKIPREPNEKLSESELIAMAVS